ncbi:unnamed protein product [Brassicogethes aeneus]|uniref:UDENN FLCN/SMCR8-type domain-containing protein n=1 Tax=Brassicogethes aeneus TaxID=1431903 RepID=A0A9P0AQ19_BRAAE|nr:unnamed protein product [Brassicogethes aeneus]
MDGIVALGHFCESHGPIVILATQKTDCEPQEKPPHILNSPVCEACKSIDLEEAVVSEDENVYYVSSRIPLKEDVAFLLKNAAVRSISCEEMGKEGGLMYFGDDQRGHVVTYTFYVADSQARGFKRKYCLILLSGDRVHLLNHWRHITKHFEVIASDLKEKALKVNNLEQATCSQKAARQASQQSTRSCTGRSLQELTGVSSIFLQIHMWFVYLLSVNVMEEIKPNILEVPISCNGAIMLRKLYKEISNRDFKKVLYCFLTGIKVESKDTEILKLFQQLLPKKFKLPQTGEACVLVKENDAWKVNWKGNLPLKLPTLLNLIEEGLNSENLPDEALESYLASFSYQWYNISCDIACCNVYSEELLKVLGVHKYDMPLLSYWTTEVRNL